MTIKRFFYYYAGKLYHDKEYKDQVSSENITYEVLKYIKIPEYLHSVVIYEQSYEEAQSNLIFTGIDSKGRKQYFYGKKYVLQRNKNRDTIFIQVHKVIKAIDKYIANNLTSDADTPAFQLAVFMLMETSFYIRTGKIKYYRENETVGLLTLQNKHLSVTSDSIIIRFNGKDKVLHEFTVKLEDKLYGPLLKIYNATKPDKLLFNLLSEKRLYSFIKQYHIRIKDLRMYGVNITFLYNIWNNVLSLLVLPTIQKLISISIKQTADTIGHSPNISKQAYMTITILELMKAENIIENIKEKSFNKFVDYVVEYVNKKNYC